MSRQKVIIVGYAPTQVTYPFGLPIRSMALKALFLCNYPLCGVESAWRHQSKLDAQSSNIGIAVPVQTTDLQDHEAFFDFLPG